MPTVPELLTPLAAWIEALASALTLVDLAFVAGAMLLIHACRHAGMWIYALIALPGTLAHEFAHFAVAFVLGARPAFPSLVPVRTERGWRLGSVAFRVGHARALPIALAPLLLAPLALWWAGALLHASPWPLRALHIWIVAALVTASLPSRTDMRLALPALAVLAVVGIAVALAWWLL